MTSALTVTKTPGRIHEIKGIFSMHNEIHKGWRLHYQSKGLL